MFSARDEVGAEDVCRGRPARLRYHGPTLIANAEEYQKAQQVLLSLEERLARLQQSNPIRGSKGFTKAGIRKMIARLHEELALYEGSEEARQPTPK